MARQLRLPLRVGGTGVWLGPHGLHSLFIVNNYSKLQYNVCVTCNLLFLNFGIDVSLLCDLYHKNKASKFRNSPNKS